MALEVEDGTGKDDAESYASVAETDTYFSNLGNTAWTGTTATKEAALRKATQYLDATYNWIGYIYITTQTLGWPRTSVFDREGRDLKESVPLRVKRATYELALASLSGDLIQISDSSKYVKSEQVGSLAVTYRDDAPIDRNYRFADRLLSGLYTTKNGGGSKSLVRA